MASTRWMWRWTLIYTVVDHRGQLGEENSSASVDVEGDGRTTLVTREVLSLTKSWRNGEFLPIPKTKDVPGFLKNKREGRFYFPRDKES